MCLFSTKKVTPPRLGAVALCVLIALAKYKETSDVKGTIISAIAFLLTLVGIQVRIRISDLTQIWSYKYIVGKVGGQMVTKWQVLAVLTKMDFSPDITTLDNFRYGMYIIC